ncbi:MAG: hypothetical protein ACJAWN_000755, partial [Neolewinella sp.]
MKNFYLQTGRIGLLSLLLCSGFSLFGQCGSGQDTIPPVITPDEIAFPVRTSVNSQACPGNTFIEDSFVPGPIPVSDIIAFGDAFLPGLFDAMTLPALLSDNCTTDPLDLFMEVTNVEHNILANGNDSLVIIGIAIDEQGNQSAPATVSTVLFIDDTGPVITPDGRVLSVFTSATPEACPGNTFIEDSFVPGPIPVSNIIAFSDAFLPGLFDTMALPALLSDDCTTDPLDLFIEVTNVEHNILANGNDSLVITGIAIDEQGNESEPATVSTVLFVDDTAPVAVCQDVTVQLDSMGNASVQASVTPQSVTSFTGAFEATSPAFNRPTGASSSCSLGFGGEDHFFEAFEFSVDADDMYTFEMQGSSDFDGYFLIYEGDFDPANPCDNHLNGDDDDGVGNGNEPSLMLQLNLASGNYTLVATTFRSNETGAFSIDITSDNGGNVFLASGENIAAIDNGSSDNCGSVTLALDITDFTCVNLGDNTVTLTATDASGNSDTCTAIVTVEDNIAPVATGNDQTIVLSDDNLSQTLMVSSLLTATDNCGGTLTFDADRVLTFNSDDIGQNTITITVTDVNGNVTFVTAIVTVTFDQPNLACIGNINLTLNDDCQALIIPRMVLAGNTGLIDAFPFSIVVQDSDPSNGPIIDGCGAFTYSISVPADNDPTIGFTSAFRPSNWTEILFGGSSEMTPTSEQIVEVDFTSTAMILSTEATVFSTGSNFGAQQGITFSESGTANFDYDFNGVDANFDQVFSITTFGGDVVDIQFNATTATSGTASVAIEPGYSLIIQLNDDGFQPFAGQFASVLTIDNFSFVPPVNPLALDFETCWGIVNAEDKTAPALVTTPDDIDLLCVDLDDNNISTLANTVSHCYRVNAQTGNIVPGTMASALRALLLARTASPVVPVFTDG